MEIVKTFPTSACNADLENECYLDSSGGRNIFQTCVPTNMELSGTWKKFSRTCTYNVSELKTEEQANVFKERFGASDPDYMIVLNQVCSRENIDDCRILDSYCANYPNDVACATPVGNESHIILIVVLLAIAGGIAYALMPQKTDSPQLK
jgi:hypothetical protein